MTGDINQTTCTATKNSNKWNSTVDSTYSDNYTITRCHWDTDWWHDTKEYKQLIKEGIVKALKESWMLRNFQIKRKTPVKINRGNKIRNQLPRKIRKD